MTEKVIQERIKSMKRLLQVLGLEYFPEFDPVLTEAFTHRSSVNEKTGNHTHNERLEFLGDAVLELVSTEFLFNRFPDKQEGELTNIRSALVCGQHLAQVARKLKFGQYLILSAGEARSGGADKDYLLANVVEAFIGAVYKTQGMKAVQKFISEWVLDDVEEIIRTGAHRDAKSEFQEITQGDLGFTPHYEVLLEEGKDHEKKFEMGAYIEEHLVGKGIGGSKKEAQMAAAANALTKKVEWLKLVTPAEKVE